MSTVLVKLVKRIVCLGTSVRGCPLSVVPWRSNSAFRLVNDPVTEKNADDEEKNGSDTQPWSSRKQRKPVCDNESKKDRRPHIPVLCKDVLESFWRLSNVEDPALTILDMTFGAGGHSKALLETFPSCTVLALDRDPTAKKFMDELSDGFQGRVVPLCGRFTDLPQLMKSTGRKKHLDGILLDAGCSSMQMDDGTRGFSISKPDFPLDMRMDMDRDPEQISAADVVNKMPEPDLARIFKKYGEEDHAVRIARAIVESRFMMKKIRTTGDLASIVETAVGWGNSDRIGRSQHPATRIFQALRIFVNDELNQLDFALSFGRHLLRPGGIFAAITFHSLEDKIVKTHFQSADWKNKLTYDPLNPTVARSFKTHAKWLPKEDLMDTMKFQWAMITKHAIQASQEEVEYNPRARSAKLRAALKVDW